MDPYLIIEKYYKKGSMLHQLLIEHSEAVKNKALEIAARHPELHPDSNFITEAALLHDIGIFLCDAPGIFCTGSHQYIEHGYLGADIIRNEGFPRHALVCERHTGTGLTLEKIISHQLPIPQRNMMPESVEEQIICFADKFYSK